MSTQTALVIIDVQCGMIDANNPHHEEVLTRIQNLLHKAQSSEIPVIYVQHDGPKGHGLEVGSENWHIHPAIAPQDAEPVVHKRASDSFYDTALKQELDKRSIKQLVVVGGQTDYCVDTTVRRATTFGYNVMLVGDAHLTYDTDILSEAQIIAFYNDTLNGFATDDAKIEVKNTVEIQF